MSSALRRLAWSATAEPFALSVLAYARLLERVCVIDVDNPPAPAPTGRIFVNWHRDLSWLLVHHGRHRRALLQSQAPHMAPLRRWCQRLGLVIIPGASGEGIAGAVERMAAAIRAGDDVVIACDGPAGPPFRTKRGPLLLARATGAPIIPVGYRSSLNLRLPHRWDNGRVHVPLERITVQYGPPIFVDDDDDASLRAIEAGLNALPIT